MIQRRRLGAILTCLAVFSVAVVGTSASLAGVVSAQDEHFVDEEKLPFESLPGHPSEVFWGKLGDAGYRAEIPENWNGDLVMWAHGFRGEGLELTVDNGPIREHLVAQGYAWAASSYERNGYDVLTGVESTKVLAEFVRDTLAPSAVDRIYITGASMGGHVTGLSIEQHHRLYDGAMPVCGVMGDYDLFDYFLDFAIGSQQLALGESHFPVDPAEWAATTVPQIKENLTAVPGGWPFVLNEQGEMFKSLVELRSGGVRPNFDQGWAFWNGFPTATGFGNFLFDLGSGDGTLPNSDGLVVLDNIGVRYQLDSNSHQTMEERAFNKSIARVAQDKGARKNERITGDIRDRVLTLHNLGDLFVPFEMEIAYARDVRTHGKESRLVQRAIRGAGHCDFTDLELTTGFDDLVTWVETGARPAGDEILRRRAVAKDDYGCQFSDPDHTLHTFAEPCT